MTDKEVLDALTTPELAELVGVDPATARRWKASQRLPETVRRLLEVTALGRLDVLGWKGWRIVRGELIGPDGWSFRPGEVMALPLLRQQLAAYQTQERKFLGMAAQPEEPDELAGEFLARVDRGRA